MSGKVISGVIQRPHLGIWVGLKLKILIVAVLAEFLLAIVVKVFKNYPREF